MAEKRTFPATGDTVMKPSILVGMCSIMLGMFACAGQTVSVPDVTNDGADEELKASQALRCDADSGTAKLALIPKGTGKGTLLSLTPAADVYALGGAAGTVTAKKSGWSFKATGNTLTLDASLKGKWVVGSKSTNMTCTKATADEAGSWRAASALVDYAGEIDGLADTVQEEMSGPKAKAYTVFAVETSRRSALDLGTKPAKSGGALPGDDGESLLDENDFSYGAMSAAYSLGGGEDYGEWFQGASDGISLAGDVAPALGSGVKAGFIAHEKVKALSTLVDSAAPSAVELTVGAWTFLLPDAFSK